MCHRFFFIFFAYYRTFRYDFSFSFSFYLCHKTNNARWGREKHSDDIIGPPENWLLHLREIQGVVAHRTHPYYRYSRTPVHAHSTVVQQRQHCSIDDVFITLPSLPPKETGGREGGGEGRGGGRGEKNRKHVLFCTYLRQRHISSSPCVLLLLLRLRDAGRILVAGNSQSSNLATL